MDNLRDLDDLRQRWHDDAEKAEALRLYLLGLTNSEIAKLTGINVRTIERFSMRGKWKLEKKKQREREAAQMVSRILKIKK